MVLYYGVGEETHNQQTKSSIFYRTVNGYARWLRTVVLPEYPADFIKGSKK